MSSGGKVGGGGMPPGVKQFHDSDGFADDKVGAEKAKKEQNKRASKNDGQKSRAAELAKQVQKVQKAMMQDGQDAPAAKRLEEAPQQKSALTRGQGGREGKPTLASQLKEGGAQLTSLQQLLNQLDDALVDATELIGSSFADDKLGAEQASKKQAKDRAKQDANKKSSQDKANKDLGRTREAAQTGQDAKNKEKVVSKNLEMGEEGTGGNLQKGAKNSRLVKQTLSETIRNIEDQAAKLLRLGNLLGKQATAEGKASHLREMAAKLAAAHQKFKELLLPLLLGELGELRKNRYLQFKRLFDASAQWPQTVPPGRTCARPDDWSDEEWDAFLSWFFVAPDLPEDLDY